jgi:predicted NBD/HSP70 family sugar kinase/DNA-binding CsgD family transcriptional regulator
MATMARASERRTGLRELHLRQIVDVIRERGGASRGEIARRTGLSRAAISAHVGDLKARGLIVEEPVESREDRRQARGRPPARLQLAPSSGAVLAIVFDHESLRVALSDLSLAPLGERSLELAIYAQTDENAVAPQRALASAAELASTLLAEAGVERSRVLGAGLVLPAPIDQRAGTVASQTILHLWKDLKPAAELSRVLGVHVELDNDANAGALGELSFGAGRELSDFIYVKHSPAVGAALVLDGRLYRGASGIAGELGHIQVNPDGEICHCGKRGCLGPTVSTDAMIAVLRSTHGDRVTALEIRELLARGDLVASRVVADAGRTLGEVLAGFCSLLNPTAVIVQGTLSADRGPLLAGVREAIDRYAMPEAAEIVSVKAGALGERAELLGAAALVVGNTARLPSDRLLALASS